MIEAGSEGPEPPPREYDPHGEGRTPHQTETARLRRSLDELRQGVDAHSIVAFTDPQGVILDVNDKFVELSQYTREELIGAPQSIVHSERHPDSFFAEMWRTVSRGEIWQGTLCNRAKGGSEYWLATTIVPLFDDEGRIERYLSIHTDVTQLYFAEARVRRLAYSDPLTGLPNRAMMLGHLTARADEAARGPLVYVTAEFDDLLMINDTFGFAAGDRFLRRIADEFGRLQAGAGGGSEDGGSRLGRRPELVARVGSAAFGAVFSGFGGGPEEIEAEMAGLAERLGEMLGAAVAKELGVGVEPMIRVSYVPCLPGDGLDGSEVFTRAEIARRYGPRTRGEDGSTAAVFEQSMIDEVRERSELVRDLRRCVAEKRLRLHLQPVVTADRRVVGYEGLVRWADEKRGLVTPAEFIPLAERTGIIIEIGDWVLDEACRILAEWAKDPETSERTVAVNVSERQLRSGVLVESVRAALRRHGAPPERLRLEVTESELHRDLERSVQILEELRAERVQISLDDFGTGYSSLNHLSRLPVQQLKIDRAFVAPVVDDETGAAIVGTIVQLARLMGLSIVAEGIETEAQFEALRGFGIDAFQGFLFGRPEPLAV